MDDLLAALYDHGIALDWPIYPLVDGERGLELTVFGTSRAIQRAAAALSGGVRLDLERIGEYEPETGPLSGTLTGRQRELLDLAVREGYYEVPRRTTHREIAATLDLSTGTVSERLQRIESTLVTAYVDAA